MNCFAEADVLSMMGLDLEGIKNENEMIEHLGSDFSQASELFQQLNEKQQY
jgi:hypothetical protein